MNGLQDVEGVMILGLVLMAVAAGSALRCLYTRSAIPFLARARAVKVTQQPSIIIRREMLSRKAA